MTDSLTDEKKVEIDFNWQLCISSVDGRETVSTSDTIDGHVTDIIREALESSGCRVSGAHYCKLHMTISAEMKAPQ